MAPPMDMRRPLIRRHLIMGRHPRMGFRRSTTRRGQRIIPGHMAILLHPDPITRRVPTTRRDPRIVSAVTPTRIDSKHAA
jgi:hypothetical protein